ncbi:CobW family GTP-binding protein [Marinobacter segnicrescens]|uniref:CobW family GTP-binding protein n=1 Tax=Marinobacter segnicrescens TaxID=430453 RepID=UPI003A8E7E07
MPQPQLKTIPTNIITGFLGAGKTTAILHLLRHKPDNERWAVLINEFGEIGVDGTLVQGTHTEEDGIFVREVPGGCMCCTAGLPMQIALNQLLAKARPHRLLIEPTGLGHPAEVLQTLAAEHYREVLSIQKTITLVDARKLADARYTSHDTFNQQIAIADLVVGNKQDLYDEADRACLEAYVQEKGSPGTPVEYVIQGAIDPQWLKGPASLVVPAYRPRPAQAPNARLLGTPGSTLASSQGEGYESIGWRFDAGQVFDYGKLLAFLTGLEAERMKAAFITDRGVFGYNLTRDGLTEIELDDLAESRFEAIATPVDSRWESRLQDCLLT